MEEARQMEAALGALNRKIEQSEHERSVETGGAGGREQARGSRAVARFGNGGVEVGSSGVVEAGGGSSEVRSDGSQPFSSFVWRIRGERDGSGWKEEK